MKPDQITALLKAMRCLPRARIGAAPLAPIAPGRKLSHRPWRLASTGRTFVVIAIEWALICSFRAGGSESPVESFKAFVSSPPTLSDLTWTEEQLSNAESTNYYRMKYQPGALFLGHANSPIASPTATADSYGIVVSRFGSNYWVKEFNALYVWTNTHNPREQGNSADALFHLKARTEAARILNMGFQQAPIASIRWQHNSCSVTNVEEKSVFSAVLTAGLDGRASELVVERRRIKKPANTPPDSTVIYEYSYDTALPLTYLPSTIEAYSQQRGGPRKGPLYRWRIINVAAAAAPLPESAFSLIPYTGSGAEFQYYISNEYRVSLNGKDPTPTLDPHKQAAKPKGAKLRARYIIWAIGILLAAPLLFLARKRSGETGA